MRDPPITAAGAAHEAMDFARLAWRRLWPVQLLAASAPALMFVSLRAPLMPGQSEQLWRIAWIIGIVAWAPLWTGLHRLALGGAAARRIWPGGLQFGPSEVRFVGLGAAVVFGSVLSLLPLIAVSAGVFVFGRDLGVVRLDHVGPLQVSFLIVAGVWGTALLGMGYMAARFAFAPVATVARRRLVLTETLALTRGRATTIAAAWILAQAPALLVVSLVALVDSMESDALGLGSRWPLPDAIAAGATLGLVTAFLQAPLTAGVLTRLYQNARARRAEAAASRIVRQAGATSEPFPGLQALS